MPTPSTFDLLAKIHAARAELDQTVLRLVEQEASAPTPPTGVTPLAFGRPGDRNPGLILEPGEKLQVAVEHIPWAIYRVRGFRVHSEAPVPTGVFIGDLMCGGGVNLFFHDTPVSAEALRETPPVLRESPILRAPNTVQCWVQNQTANRVPLTLVLLVEPNPPEPTRPSWG